MQGRRASNFYSPPGVMQFFSIYWWRIGSLLTLPLSRQQKACLLTSRPAKEVYLPTHNIRRKFFRLDCEQG